MASMKVNLMIVSERNGESERIATVDLPALPRKGDRMLCDGPPFGPDAVDFVVDDVYWNVNVDDARQGDGYPEVYLWLPPEDRCFRPYCTCSADERKCPPDEKGNCLNCGDRRVGFTSPSSNHV
jgi:hypothetical protein